MVRCMHCPFLSRRLATLSVCLGLSFAVSPLVAAADAPIEVVIGGTGAALGAMQALGEAYTATAPNTRVRIVPSLGSGGGIKALAAGAIQVAVTSRPLTEEERAKGLTERELIRTPFIFAVHQKAAVSGASLAELAEIYAGTRGTWKDGSKTRPILRPATDIDTEVLSAMSPALRVAVKAAHQLPGKNIAVTDTDTADEIERVPGALGTSTLILVKSEKRALKALDVEGVAATVPNMRSGRYPYQKSIYIVVAGNSGAAAKAFTAYAASPAVAPLIASLGALQITSAP